MSEPSSVSRVLNAMNEHVRTAPKASDLESLFHPSSIAIVGSPSQPAANQGAGVFLDALISFGYTGAIYPVNPKATEIRGHRTFPDFRSLPQTPDMVICCIPASLVPGLVEDCVKRGVKAISIYTAGFGEANPDGRRIQQEMADLARRGGMRLIGPNCMGLYCPRSRLSYSPLLSRESGSVGMFCQSGGNSLALVIMANYLGIHFSKVISYGNAADLTEAEILEYLAQDTETEVICAYIEGVKEGRRFFNVLGQTTKSKPVAVLQGGRTRAGAEAALSHTGSLASHGALWQALCRQSGAAQVDSIEGMVDFIEACLHMKRPPGRRVGLVAWGGGPSVLSTDDTEAAGFVVPRFSQDLRGKLSRLISEAGSSVANPVDSAMLAEPSLLSEAVRIVADSGEVDIVLVRLPFAVGGPPFDPDLMQAAAEAVFEAGRITRASVALVMPHGDTPASSGQFMDLRRMCLKARFPLFPATSRAARALAQFTDSMSRLESWSLRQV